MKFSIRFPGRHQGRSAGGKIDSPLFFSAAVDKALKEAYERSTGDSLEKLRADFEELKAKTKVDRPATITIGMPALIHGRFDYSQSQQTVHSWVDIAALAEKVNLLAEYLGVFFERQPAKDSQLVLKSLPRKGKK